MKHLQSFVVAVGVLLVVNPGVGEAQEARRRWDRMCQIRKEKFDLILPEVMRENNIDMWIVLQKEGNYDPLYEDLGRGYTGSIGYYIFTDRGGERIERVAAGTTGKMLEACDSYDEIMGSVDLGAFVAQRDPRRIGINTSHQIGAADGLSHTGYLHLVEELGDRYAARLVSAEKLVSDFRSRRTVSEIVAFGEAGEWSRKIAERALSNEVITPGVTALEDVAWWMWDQLLANGLGSSFDMPSVYVTGPDGIVASSNERIIQRGDVMMIDWGVGYLNFYTDMKRVAYVLKEGESALPASLQHAFDQAMKVRDVIKSTVRPGRTAQANYDEINARIDALPGFSVMSTFNEPGDSDDTDVIVGSHSVGNTGHGIGPSMAFFNPLRLTFEVRPMNLFSIEFFAYTPLPEWGGAKLRVPIEDDGVVTERGIEWLYPVVNRFLLIR